MFFSFGFTALRSRGCEPHPEHVSVDGVLVLSGSVWLSAPDPHETMDPSRRRGKRDARKPPGNGSTAGV